MAATGVKGAGGRRVCHCGEPSVCSQPGDELPHVVEGAVIGAPASAETHRVGVVRHHVALAVMPGPMACWRLLQAKARLGEATADGRFGKVHDQSPMDEGAIVALLRMEGSCLANPALLGRGEPQERMIY